MSRLKLFLLDLKSVGLQDSPANQQAKIILLRLSLRKSCLLLSWVLKLRNSVVRKNNETISLFERLLKPSMSPQSDQFS